MRKNHRRLLNRTGAVCRSALISGLFVAIASVARGQYLDQAAEDRLFIVPVPSTELAPSRPPTTESLDKIRGWIAELPQTDREDFGLSPSIAGTAFAPQTGTGRMRSLPSGGH